MENTLARQSHEEREVQTLVDRIEKKVSDRKLATPSPCHVATPPLIELDRRG
jgi:hypothetical protein